MILHIISGLSIGGAEATLVQVAAALQARGLPQHVVSVSNLDGNVPELKSRGIDVTMLGMSSLTDVPMGVARLVGLIGRLDARVVQGWMYHGNIVAALAHRIAFRRKQRRLYWNLRASNMDAARYDRIIRLGAWLSRWPDLIIANSQAGAEFHFGRGYHPRRLEVIGNGIDTQKFRPDRDARAALRAEFGIPMDAVVAIHAARVDPMKDHATMLAALAAAPQVVGLLVGAGTEELTMPPNVRALGLRRDLTRLYASADLVLSSSAFGEGFSNAIAEGMSAGLVPIATNVGDARDIVGETGRLVAPGDAAALAAAIAAEAAVPADDRAARGLHARERIVERFPLSRTINNYARLYSPEFGVPA
jgi:glycosyltransferase involved in cell wall biosynthesis